MNDEQILARCYMLGRAAFERGLPENQPGASVDERLREFYGAVLKDRDLGFRLDAMDNWHAGWQAARKEASA